MQDLAADQPGIPQAQSAPGFWSGPIQDKDLHCLCEMLDPVGEHDNHVEPQGSLVPRPVQKIEQVSDAQ
jgi:hypothetical protein